MQQQLDRHGVNFYLNIYLYTKDFSKFSMK